MELTLLELKKQNARLKQRLLDTQSLTQVGSWDWDLLTNKVEWTDMMYLLLGHVPHTVEPTYALALHHVHDDDKAIYEKTIEKCLKEKSVYKLRNRIVLDNKTIIPVVSMGRCILNDSGAVIRMVGTVQDVTSQIIAENNLLDKEKAIQSDKNKSVFLAKVSHEIRNPLNAIFGFSEQLRNENLIEENKVDYLNIIQSSCKSLKSIVENILDLSKIDAKEISPSIDTCNLNEIMNNLHRQFSDSNANSSISIRLNKALVDNDSFIKTDNVRLIQILTNLLENALKFTEQGYVEFGYNINNNFIQFFVTDTGMGINPKDYNLIFERFKLVDHQNENSGTGLGLSICKELVNVLGGEIWIDSLINKGSTFYFTIPYSRIDVEIENRGIKIIQQKNNIPEVLVLVAEDNYNNFKYIEVVLKQENYGIIHAKNGQEAVNIIKEKKPIDLIIMDIRMPVMDGITACRLIKEIDINIPIVIQSGDLINDIKKEAKDAGCDAIMVKPFSKDELLEVIEKQLK